jgi:pimeloyl-ACP methyl ester carboxylesterase
MSGRTGVEHEEVHFFNGATRLAGTISRPASPTPTPGLVMIGGSGPSDRHNDGFFDVLGAAFVQAGVAVLAYDKREAWETATLDELAADAEAAVEALGCDARVSAAGTGVLGHSEGGWVALRLCVKRPALKHLILNSCPATSFLEAEFYALAAGHGDAATAKAAQDLLQALVDCARSGADYEAARRIVADASEEPWYPRLAQAGFELDRATWRQLSVWNDYDPRSDLRVLTTPTLAVLGADDPLVPVAASVVSFDETARQSGRAQQTAVFPHAGHRLQLAAENSLAPGYLDTLREWVQAHSLP